MQGGTGSRRRADAPVRVPVAAVLAFALVGIALVRTAAAGTAPAGMGPAGPRALQEPPRAGTGREGVEREGSGVREASAEPTLSDPVADDAVGPAWADDYRALHRLRGEEYAKALDALADAQPEDALAACVLRAGRPAPPVVTATRKAEREALRGDALEWLGGRLAGTDRAEWIARIDALLGNPQERAGGNERSARELWTATARAIGTLGLDELSEELALALEDESGVRRQAARQALFDMHLRWYASLADFMTRRETGDPACRDPRYVAELRAQVELARRRLGEILRLDPERGFTALGDIDPAVRADAARALGRGAADGAVDRDAAFEQLMGVAIDESSGVAFHAALEALLGMQAGAAPDAIEIDRLRLLLRSVILSGRPQLQASVSRALGQLPVAFSVESKGARVDQMLFLLDDQLGVLVKQGGLVDDDVMLACLRAALGLCERARTAGVDFGDEMTLLRQHLYAVLVRDESFREVRQAAAQVLARLTRPADLDELARSMEQRRQDPELVFVMIGPLADAAAAAEPTDPGAQRALELLVSWCSHPDVDVRGRAIAAVGDVRLDAVASGIGASGFTQQLSRESVPELQRALLALLARHGSTADALRILELENFDALVVGNPANVAAMVRALSDLAGGDHELVFRSGERLLEVSEPATRVRRLGDAILMLARLSEEEAQMLAREQHDAVLDWAMELRAAGGQLVAWNEPSVCAAFLQRLTELHLPRSLDSGTQPSPFDEHRLALLLSDLDSLVEDAVRRDEILRHFERALAGAENHPEADLLRPVVLRDRARYHLSAGQPELARADYRKLLELDGADSKRLDLSDLRAAGEVIERVPRDPEAPTAQERAAAAEAYVVSRQLVARPAWTAETGGLRLADLVDLAERARWSRDRAVMDEALALLAGLPPEVAESAPPVPPGAAWAGLAVDAARLERLRAEREAVAAAHALLPEPAAPADAGASEEPEPSSPEDPDEEGSQGTVERQGTSGKTPGRGS